MPPIGVHHTDTVDSPWDGPGNEARLSNDAGAATYRREYAWVDPAADEDTKVAYKFPHHEVGADGTPGAANLNGCRNGLSRIPQANVPDADRAGIESHLQAHLDDAKGTAASDDEIEPLALIAPRSYRHVTKALHERPWAIQPQVLSFMVDLVRNRIAGIVLSQEQIDERLAEAKAANGDRAGGAIAGAVAVIPMYGLITQRESLMSAMSGGTSIDELRSLLRSAIVDPAVQAVVFDIDSPGGSVDGVPEFAAELRQLSAGSKPIVAQVNTLCASAAYWLASSMTEIVSTQSGEVGSIGVYAAHEDVSRAEDMAGVKTTLISAGPFKTEGNSFEPLSDDARAAIQDQVDEFYSMFLTDVAKGRHAPVDAIAADYGQGRTLLARKAKAAGMVDRIDTLEATVRRLQPAKASAPRPANAAVILLSPAAIAAMNGQPDRGWNQRMKGKFR
jgi:signal peptide peptidase SppA